MERAVMSSHARPVVHDVPPETFHHEQHYKVPLWIGPDRKLVSGVKKTTTCQDVIRSLVHSPDDPSKFVIVEKWRKMERRLDPSDRILKVWKTWGDQQNEVALILREQVHHSSTDGYIDKKMSHKGFRRKSSQVHRLTNHEESNEEAEMTDSMERLLKLVLTQGETIQAQLKKLRHQEEQIERYEERMHRIRSLEDGENYVVESYLRDEKSHTGRKSGTNTLSRKRDKSPKKQSSSKRESKVSGGANAGSKGKKPSSSKATVQVFHDLPLEDDPMDPESELTLSQQNELMEMILELNSKLTREEERLVKLGMKLRKIYERQSASADNPNDPFLLTVSEDTELKHVLVELETLREVTSEQTREIERNEQSLTEMEQMLDSKQDHVSHLTYEIQLLDVESELLHERLQVMTQGFPHYAVQPLEPGPSCRAMIDLPGPSNPGRECVQVTSTGSSPTSVDNRTCACVQHSSSGACCCAEAQMSLHSSKPDQHDNDSNSDTGISSLHSSGDENNLFALDTLV